jgi:protein TonB
MRNVLRISVALFALSLFAGQSQDYARLDEGITRPKVIRHVNPTYPDAAKQAGAQGIVVVEAKISAQGKVDDVTVLRDEAGHGLGDAAAAAVRQWEFEPAKRVADDQPVAVAFNITINFRL